MAGRTSDSLVYRYKKSLPISELNNDVFKKLASLISPEFLSQCHSASYGTFAKAAEMKKQKGGINMEEALHVLSNEDWRVENLVAGLIQVDNRIALQQLLYFWPAHFVTVPPSEIIVGDGEQLCIDIEVRGFPTPRVEWYFPNCSSAGTGPSLVHDYDGLPFGTYFVKVSNRRATKQSSSRYFHEERRSFEVKSSAHNALPAFADDEEGPQSGAAEPQLPQCSAPPPQPLRGPPPQVDTAEKVEGAMPKTSSPAGEVGGEFKATRKVAFLFGMCNYANVKPLRAAYTDIPALAAALTKLGYRVHTYFDTPLKYIVCALEIYARLLDEGAYGFLYFGGHGEHCSSNQDDYIIPVDAPSSRSCKSQLLSRQRVISLLQGRTPALNIIVWDTCRMDNEGLSNGVPEQSEFRKFQEEKLIVFMPCVAMQKAYEVNYNGKVRSALVLKMLALIEDDKSRPPAYQMFVQLAKELCNQEICRQDQNGVETRVPVNPFIQITAFESRSFWDPVDESVNVALSSNPILNLWNEQCHLIDGIYPEPQFEFDVGLSQRDLRFMFFAHNVLALQLRSASSCAFDIPVMCEDFPRNGLDPEFVHAELEMGSPNLCRKVTLHHLQLWNPHSGDIHLPVLLLSTNQRSRITLRKLHIRRLFEAIEEELALGYS